MPLDLVGGLGSKEHEQAAKVLWSRGLETLAFHEAKDCSYSAAAEHISLASHRPSGAELSASSIQDKVSATGTEVRAQVAEKSKEGLDMYGVTFGEDKKTIPGLIPDSMIHPVIPMDSPTRITKKDIKRVMKKFNKKWRPREQWISYKQARRCLEADPMHTVYCFIDDICVKHQKENRSVNGIIVPPDPNDKHLFYTTNIYILYRDQKYCFTASNTYEGCRMLLGLLLNMGLLENNELVFFSDGAEEIKTALENVFWFRPYKYLIDWFHVQKRCYQHFTGMLKGGKGRLEENEKIREAFFNLLWPGNLSGAVEYVKNLDPSLIKREESRTALLTYLKKKEERLYEFAIRRELKLINSSNRVEQLNNLSIALRQKKNGMSWCRIGSPALANVTMLFINKEFDNWERHHCLSFKMTKTNGRTCRVKWSRDLDMALRAA